MERNTDAVTLPAAMMLFQAVVSLLGQCEDESVRAPCLAELHVLLHNAFATMELTTIDRRAVVDLVRATLEETIAAVDKAHEENRHG